MRGPRWTSCSFLLSQQLHLLPVETPNLTEDHYREKQRNNWLDEDSRWMHGRIFGRMNNRVLVVNELSAAGNQVASFMKSQRAFSASFPNFLFFTLTSLCALFPENPLTVPFPLLYLTQSQSISTLFCCVNLLVMFMAIIVFLKCSQFLT